MSFLINPTRKHTFKYVEEDVSFSVTFEFTCAEDMDLSEIKKRLSNLDATKKDDPINQDRATNFMFYNLRKSLVDCEDIMDQDTNESIKIKNADGSINEEIQKGVFEAIRNLMCTLKPAVIEGDKVIEEAKQEPFLNRIMTAYLGTAGKNVKAGATQS